jgi:iron complex outermembrane receptor protein
VWLPGQDVATSRESGMIMKTHRIDVHPALLPLAVGATLLSLGAAAQSPSTLRAEGRLEEVLVTARKVEEKSQEVPLSLRVLSSEELQKQGFDTLSDSGLLLPGLTYDIGGFVQDTRPAMLRRRSRQRGAPHP